MNHVHVIVSYWKYIWDRTEDHLFEYCMDWKVWFTVLVTKQLIHATKPRLITSSSSQTWILVKGVWIRNKQVSYYLNIWSSQIDVLTPNTILIWLKCICDLMTDCIGVFVYPVNIWLDIGQSAYVSVWSDTRLERHIEGQEWIYTVSSDKWRQLEKVATVLLGEVPSWFLSGVYRPRSRELRNTSSSFHCLVALHSCTIQRMVVFCLRGWADGSSQVTGFDCGTSMPPRTWRDFEIMKSRDIS